MSKDELKNEDEKVACAMENSEENVKSSAEPKANDVNESEKSVQDDSKSEEPCEKTEEVQKELTVEEKLAESEKQIAQLKDQYLRKCADFDNYRKKMIREKQEAFDYANANLLADLLGVLDDLDRALLACTEKENEAAKSFIAGVEMIQKQLKNMLESKYNLSSFGEKGDIFDPEKHEALASNQADVEEPVLAEVYLKGYMLKERILRHAKVVVNMPKKG
ncbi:MAG: nucleotide exchange factor GrpE [Treponemataceae bacterium]